MKGDPGRSDTTILLRVDPDKHAIALLSIPRDLKVNIPGVRGGQVQRGLRGRRAGQDARGRQAAHGPRRSTTSSTSTSAASPTPSTRSAASTSTSTATTTSRRTRASPRSTSRPATSGCAATTRSSTCASATSTTTSCARRASRTSSARRARSCRPEVLIRDRDKLLDIFTKYTTSDIADAVPLLELLKTFLGVAVGAGARGALPGAARRDLRDRRRRRRSRRRSRSSSTPRAPRASARRASHRPNEQQSNGGGNGGKEQQAASRTRSDHFEGPPMDDSTEQGQRYAHQISIHEEARRRPDDRLPGLLPDPPRPGLADHQRQPRVPDRRPGQGRLLRLQDGRRRPGRHLRPRPLRRVLRHLGHRLGRRADPLQPVARRGRSTGSEYLLFYDGDRLRLVGWKTPKGAYWVNNTLLQSLDEGQMLSIATSMREYEGK